MIKELMNKELKEKWIEALRSTTHREGTKRLERDEKICLDALLEWEEDTQDYEARI